MSKTKNCPSCGRRDLPITSFYRRKDGADGRYTDCKRCMRAKRMQRYIRENSRPSTVNELSSANLKNHQIQ